MGRTLGFIGGVLLVAAGSYFLFCAADLLEHLASLLAMGLGTLQIHRSTKPN
jgi:hypothetical protein